MPLASAARAKWPYAVVALLFTLVGIDIGLRIAGQRAPAPDGAEGRDATRGGAAAPVRPRIVVVPAGGGATGEREDAPRAPEPPDPYREAAAKKVAEWAARAPDAGPFYESRAAEPPMPPLDEKAAALARSADEALRKGDRDAALRLLGEAEAAADDPRQKDDMRVRRLWILFEANDWSGVRRLAEDLGERAVRAENRRLAAELLAKLDKKASK
jgi:hypothetical protein